MLATIVVVRIVLSWLLTVEIDGVWPWKKQQTPATRPEGADDGNGNAVRRRNPEAANPTRN